MLVPFIATVWYPLACMCQISGQCLAAAVIRRQHCVVVFPHNPCNIVEYVVLDGCYHTHLRHGIQFTPHGRNHSGSQMRRRGGGWTLSPASPPSTSILQSRRR